MGLPEACRRLRRRLEICVVAGVVCIGGLALAASASAGQIVWSASGAIWVMNDDGSDPHELVSAAATQLARALPDATLTSPDVFQNGGSTVLFLASSSAFAPSAQPQACGSDCAASFELAGGTLTDLGPAAGAKSGTAYYESQPRVSADGRELFGSALYTGITSGALPLPAVALEERSLAAGAPPTQWSNTDSESEPASGFDGAPDPADPTQAAWAEQQICNFTFQGQNACQYAIHVGVASDASAPVAIYDKEYDSSAGGLGQGPTSLAWSPDGSTLLMVDPFAPNDGIYEFAAVGAPATKTVTEVIAQPGGWTFGQARFAGSAIIFDAHRKVGANTTGDIFSIPAACTVATDCTFPASATNLTNNPSADNSDPAWTSDTQPIAALPTPPPARVTRLRLAQQPIRAGRRFTILVTLSAAGTIVARIAGRPAAASKTRAFGSLSLAGRAGLNRLAILRVGGRTLAPGSYTATVSVRGSSAPARTIHFTLRA